METKQNCLHHFGSLQLKCELASFKIYLNVGFIHFNTDEMAIILTDKHA